MYKLHNNTQCVLMHNP